MPLNLILDPWIPVLRDGGRDIIRPDQIAEAGVELLDWPRPDFNLACLELLVGLVYLAAPPGGDGDWAARKADAPALRAAMAPLAPAFNLLGEGPRFLQDLEPLTGDPLAPDMLFIDSAGENAAKKNSDLMVKRARFPALDLPMAAMALYTLQAHAPAGGAGNRTSMRGGGPLVTLVRPDGAALWPLVWANTPEGEALRDLTELPWMRKTATSEKGQVAPQPDEDYTPAEAFFGMPRRLRLVAEGDRVTGVIQRPYGTNYGLWEHPLSPYYAMKAGGEKLAVHPRPGPQGYRNWLGVSLAEPQGDGKRRIGWRATAVKTYIDRRARERRASVLVGGWAMSNMSPLDFIWSEQPLFPFGPEAPETAEAERLVLAADFVSGSLMAAAKAALGLDKAEGTPIEPQRETFYAQTEVVFRTALDRIAAGRGGEELSRDWLARLRRQALSQFDGLARAVDFSAIPADAKPFSRSPTMKTIVDARRALLGALSGKKLHDLLGLERKAKEEAV